MCFFYENGLTYPAYGSEQKFEDHMDLLLINDANKSHYVYIKDFNIFMCNKTKSKNKKHFYRYCLQCFSSEKVLQEHKEICLIINGKQCVKLKSGTVKSKNHLKQLAVPFKIYVDFESLLKWIQSNDKKNNTSYTEKYQDHISCSFTYTVVCIDDKFSNPVVLYRGKNANHKFIEVFMKEYDYCKI